MGGNFDGFVPISERTISEGNFTDEPLVFNWTFTTKYTFIRYFLWEIGESRKHAEGYAMILVRGARNILSKGS